MDLFLVTCYVFSIHCRFTEMPTNNFVESSFWNFDALFQPQQHPARDAHDTFFLSGIICNMFAPAKLASTLFDRVFSLLHRSLMHFSTHSSTLPEMRMILRCNLKYVYHCQVDIHTRAQSLKSPSVFFSSKSKRGFCETKVPGLREDKNDLPF